MRREVLVGVLVFSTACGGIAETSDTEGGVDATAVDQTTADSTGDPSNPDGPVFDQMGETCSPCDSSQEFVVSLSGPDSTTSYTSAPVAPVDGVSSCSTPSEPAGYHEACERFLFVACHPTQGCVRVGRTETADVVELSDVDGFNVRTSTAPQGAVQFVVADGAYAGTFSFPDVDGTELYRGEFYLCDAQSSGSELICF